MNSGTIITHPSAEVQGFYSLQNERDTKLTLQPTALHFQGVSLAYYYDCSHHNKAMQQHTCKLSLMQQHACKLSYMHVHYHSCKCHACTGTRLSYIFQKSVYQHDTISCVRNTYYILNKNNYAIPTSSVAV